MGLVAEHLHKTLSVAKALLWGKDVGEERLQKRLEICHKCDKVKAQGSLMRCGICGCKVADSGLFNLARYVEAGSYGCHHPDGSKWKAAGV
jgi:hypothetical protein